MSDEHDVVELEQKVVKLPIDANLQAAVAELEKEGWGLIPGKPPIAVYHLIRTRQQASQPSAIGKMIINEDLIQVIPGNKS